MRRYVVWWLATATAFLAGSLLPASGAVRYEQARAAMGSQFTIVAYGSDEAALETAVNEAFQEIFRLDRLLSHYRADSELSRVNRDAAEAPVKITRELFRLLSDCLRYSRETNGAFDVTVGPLLKTWGFFRGTGRLPSEDEFAAALADVGWRRVKLDEQQGTVFFTSAGIELDLGAIGKGYAADRAAEILRDAGVTSALVLASASSVVAIGAPPGQPAWTMQVRDPKDAKKSVAQVPLKDASLSTAGSYEKFFEAGGKVYTHIFDPRTGWPVQGVSSATVVARTGAETDALDTAFFVLGRERTAQYVKQHPGLRVFFCDNSGCNWIN